MVGGGTETEAQAWWDGSSPADITLGCTAVANAQSAHTYISESNIYYDSFSCFGAKQGTTNCSAYAFAEVLVAGSPSLYWEMEDGVDGCFPNQPFSASITGPLHVQPSFCKALDYSVTVSNGSGNYTYAWSVNGTLAGTNATHTHFVCETQLGYVDTIEVTVTEALPGTNMTTQQVLLQVDPLN